MEPARSEEFALTYATVKTWHRMPVRRRSRTAQRVAWIGSAAIVGGTVLGFLTPLLALGTNVDVAWVGMVSALVLIFYGVVVLKRPEAGLMAPRVMGAGALIAGIVLGILIFGTNVFGMSGNLDPGQLIEVLIFYVPFFALRGDPYSVAVVLGTVLFWGGIVLLVSTGLKTGTSASS